MPEQAIQSPSAARQQFMADLVRFINEVLPEVHHGLSARPHVDEHTPLFESGLIDSLAILHLMAFVERATGEPIPPRMVVMKHFRTVAAIGEAFGPTEAQA
jgi:acyl carrier protein